jgi:hypothetical protein
MTGTIVVNCKGRLAQLRADPRFVYVGRANRFQGLKASPFANPFLVSKDGTGPDREEAIAMYRAWLFAQPELVEQARRELRGKLLGCWCHPEACHADVLRDVADAPALVLRFYHRTDAADAILAGGFRDAEGTYLTRNVYRGVWLSVYPLDVNQGADGDHLLEVMIRATPRSSTPGLSSAVCRWKRKR